MRKIVFTFSILISSYIGNTQVNAVYWGVEDTNLLISKTTDFGTVHDYLEIFNYSGQDLNMRWIANYQPNWPSLWTCDFTNPNPSDSAIPSLRHQDIQQSDSADFFITDPIGFQNKLIIGVAHFSQAGVGTVDFKVFPVDYPDDFIVLHYTINIAQGNATASLSESIENSSIEILPLGNNLLSIQNITQQTEVNIYSLSGSKVLNQTIAEDNMLNFGTVDSGMYLVVCRQKNGLTYSKKVML